MPERPLLVLKLGAFTAGNVRRPYEPHGVVAGRDLLGEEIELIRIDLDRCIVESAHSEELAEILIQSVLQDGAVISGHIRELGFGKPILPYRDGKPGGDGDDNAKATGAKQWPKMTGGHAPSCDGR